ncbi:DNA polymerase III subunit alpha [Candidatus Microgenomates bacterium]|nr:DNA polymerase III subunit alpha [Candidatus Microgenomates bacterium]
MSTKQKRQFDPKQFVHLHNHTHYSLLDGLQKVPEMLDRAKALGMEAVAMTDHGTMSGAIEMYQEAKERGLKPLIGMEAYVAPRTHTDKVGKEDANPFHLTLIAMDNTGYENLMRLSTIAQLEGFYYKPRIDHDLLSKYHAGLIVLSGCFSGEVAAALATGQTSKAEETARWYHSVFGDRYYIELQDHEHTWPDTAKLNRQLETLAQKLSIPVVVTADAHYALPQDKEAHEVLLCVQTGSLVSDDKRMSLKDFDLYLTDPHDLAKRWVGREDYLANTKVIADRCNVTIEFDRLLIPQFPTPAGITEDAFLVEQAYKGLAWRYGGKDRTAATKLSIAQAAKLVDKAKVERLEYELGVVKQMKLSGYFLIVADFINWAKDQGIIIGPGRGSAAGSIIAYAINVTDLDPLKYDLLFERFLNPDRISMPDIDIDFQDDRRDEVIEYVANKYGQDRVAHIVTFGTMAARNAIRDTARVLGEPYELADRLAKMVPPPVQGRHTPLSKHIQTNPELKAAYRQDQHAKAVIDLAIRLEGTIRSHGVHAAGVVIAPEEIVKFAPLEMAQKGVVATQYSMNPIEKLGLLKMDFLGLSNLTIIKNTLRIIRKVHNQEIDIANLPLDDKQTFALLAKGDTTGVFQLESAGMKRYIKELKPNRFEDIVAMVALYRPGPIQWIQDFIDRKHGRKEIEYLHPKMEQALHSTYGIMVYQEQVMQIAKDLCGFTGGESDTLRKAIGKKIPALMAKMKEQFINGAIKHSRMPRATVEKFWQQLEDFAAYCFNKSHAACYGLISYWTAYLKAHFPEAFMAALLTSDFEDTDRIAIELAECKQMGIEVLPPEINESFVEFGIVPGKKAIRFALAAIKNVGVGAAEEITEERKRGGKFKSVEDFAARVGALSVNRKTWENLMKAGAFDSFADRATLIYNLDSIVAFTSKLHKDAASGQADLFSHAGTKVETLLQLQLTEAPEPVPERERLAWERQLLGVYLSQHPLEEYQAYLDSQTTPISKLSQEREGELVAVAGFITMVRKITTRNGALMAFVGIEDLSGKVELIVFPKLFEETAALWEVDKVVVVKGRISTKDREGHQGAELKILADSATEIDHEAAANFKPVAATAVPTRLVVRLPDSRDKLRLTQMKQLLNTHPGDAEVVLELGRSPVTKVRLPDRVQISPELEQSLNELFDHSVVSSVSTP